MPREIRGTINGNLARHEARGVKEILKKKIDVLHLVPRDTNEEEVLATFLFKMT